jgi:hypothetical protein
VLDLLKATGLTLLTVLVIVFAALLWSGEAKAYETTPDGYLKMQPDTDGWVYEEVYCGDTDDWNLGHTDQYEYKEWTWVTFSEGWWYNTKSKTSVWYEESQGWIPPGYDNAISYDFCEMDARGAGYYDHQNLYKHERAHAEGWDHYERPKRSNAAFYPEIYIYGR